MHYSVTPVSREVLRRRMREAVAVYVDAMGYAPAMVDDRVRAWTAHQREPGWAAVAAILHPPATPAAEAVARADYPIVGVAYCHHGTTRQWWHRQVRGGLAGTRPVPEIQALLADYVELAEIHVDPRHQGRGLGPRMLRLLLADRPEQRVLLSTPEDGVEGNRAWRLYRSLGFADVLRDFRFAGDPRPFAVLAADLPLPGRPGPGGVPGARR